MAKTSGASHALAAVAALVVGELLRQTLAMAVGENGLRAFVGAIADLLTVEGAVYARESTVEALLLVALVAALTFLWGYTYHRKRHG